MSSAISSFTSPLVEALKVTRVVAIVRGEFTVGEYSAVVHALVRAGLHTVELTIEQPNALEAIRYLSSEGPEGLWLGAGTVRSGEQARRALEAGARFLISPGFVPDVAKLAQESAIDYLPGVLTPSEIEAAVAAGCHTVKIFPAAPLGSAYLRSLVSPLRGVNLVPTGGVGVNNALEFIEAGALAVGVGGSLIGKNAEPAAVEGRARKLLSIISGRQTSA